MWKKLNVNSDFALLCALLFLSCYEADIMAGKYLDKFIIGKVLMEYFSSEWRNECAVEKSCYALTSFSTFN